MKSVMGKKSAGRAAAAILPALAVLATVAAPGGQAAAQTNGFADPAFQRVWERTDLPVQQGKVARSWVWGPIPGASKMEPFKESPGGQHLVQYFDKARMEINNPGVASSDPFYVTNGLLVVEMISGKMQSGVNTFENYGASTQLIAGDAGSDAPTYEGLQLVASVGIPGRENKAAPIAPGGVMAVPYINHFGAPDPKSPLLSGAEQVKAGAFFYETGHNIPQVFVDYLNAQGPVYLNGQYANGVVVNWATAFGYPITEPFWTTIRTGGRDRLILFQAFQRRILTYSPTNPEGWKVEMGNVGAQYYTWRYSNPAPQCARVPVRGFGRVWADNRDVARGVGCPINYAPFNQESVIQTAYQPFEHGTMLWVDRTVYTNEKLIYVFFDDGTYQVFNDTWQEGQPVSGNMTPPAGLYEPVRGFGKVWREGTGARVRERLGWATAKEIGANGAYQRFDRGEMYWSGTVNKIWVLFGSVNVSGGGPLPGQPNAFTYKVFDDTFNP